MSQRSGEGPMKALKKVKWVGSKDTKLWQTFCYNCYSVMEVCLYYKRETTRILWRGILSILGPY